MGVICCAATLKATPSVIEKDGESLGTSHGTVCGRVVESASVNHTNGEQDAFDRRFKSIHLCSCVVRSLLNSFQALGYHEYDPKADPQVHYSPEAGLHPTKTGEPRSTSDDLPWLTSCAAPGAVTGGLELHELDADRPPRNRRRRRICITIAAVVFIALAIGLGVGLGVGLTQKNRKSDTTG